MDQQDVRTDLRDSTSRHLSRRALLVGLMALGGSVAARAYDVWPVTAATPGPLHRADAAALTSAPIMVGAKVPDVNGSLAVQALASTGETWHQLAGNAARTGSNDVTPRTPWRWLWSDGPDAEGGTTAWRGMVPEEAFPVCGGDRLFMPRGTQGLFAYDLPTGTVNWVYSGAEFVAAGAYCDDGSNNFLLIGAADGRLFRIPEDWSGNSQPATYSAGSPIRKAVVAANGAAYVVCEDGSLHKVAISSMTGVWRYDGGASAGKRAETPPSFSAVTSKLVYATSDGYVHAVLDQGPTGTASWRVKPSSNPWGLWTSHVRATPNTFERGWPVIADQHGIVFMRAQLDTDHLYDAPAASSMYPATDAPTAGATIRAWLASQPAKRSLWALNLSDGSEPFVPAYGYSTIEGYVNGWQVGQMGGMPVVKVWPNGDEVVYERYRSRAQGSGITVPDFRWDGLLGEYVLDASTVPGLAAGDARFVKMGTRFSGGVGYCHINDESCQYTACGDTVFYTHWGASEGIVVNDRSTTRGLTMGSPVDTTALPAVVLGHNAQGTFNPLTHYCPENGLGAVDRGWGKSSYWVYWGVGHPPPGTGQPSSSTWSAGNAPRMTFVHKQFLIVSGNGGDLTVLRHSGSGSSFAPVPAAGPLALSGPSVGMEQTASTPFSIRVAPAQAMLTSTVTMTLSDNGMGGTFTPSQIKLSVEQAAARFTYKPPVGSMGRQTAISVTNNSSLTNPVPITFLVSNQGAPTATPNPVQPTAIPTATSAPSQPTATSTPPTSPTATPPVPQPTASASPTSATRPPVAVRVVTAGTGKLRVTITPSSIAGSPTNVVQRVKIHTIINASVNIGTLTGVQSPFVYEASDRPQQLALTIARRGPGPITVQFTTVDNYGDWTSLAGDGS